MPESDPQPRQPIASSVSLACAITAGLTVLLGFVLPAGLPLARWDLFLAAFLLLCLGTVLGVVGGAAGSRRPLRWAPLWANAVPVALAVAAFAAVFFLMPMD